MRLVLVRRMVHLAVAARPDGRVVARWVMRVAPTGTDPVVIHVVAAQCTLPLITTAAAGVMAFDDGEAAPVPVAFRAAARNR